MIHFFQEGKCHLNNLLLLKRYVWEDDFVIYQAVLAYSLPRAISYNIIFLCMAVKVSETNLKGAT